MLSHVLPFPGTAGQQRRVAYKLAAFREHFHVSFLTVAAVSEVARVREQLLACCDEALVMASRHMQSRLSRAWHRLRAEGYAWWKSLKPSNYLTGKLEFAPKRIAEALQNRYFEIVVYEYWHAVASTTVFRARRIPTVLDMHDVLWQAYARQLSSRRFLPGAWKRRAVANYRAQEERAWQQFDALIAINAVEAEMARKIVADGVPVFYTPMGIDLSRWPYGYAPVQPPRVAYYGGLGSPHNQEDALYCYEQVMPRVWATIPDAELWLVGSNPPPFLQALAADRRVKVTGFIEQVQDVLKTISVVLCPWRGTYGFRSRIIEVMAVGVPVVVTPAAVYGMELEAQQGILLEATAVGMAQASLKLIRQPELRDQQSHLARAQIVNKYSFEATYGRLALELRDFAATYKLAARKARS